jgi:tRNA-dihydrouridine synthase A
MRQPELVRDGVAAMLDAVDIPVTVKTRLGVDELDSYAYFSDFIHCVAESGCRVFVVHARKAWLSGLSPKENRDVPELRYDWVYRLQRENLQLTVVLNGGVTTAAQVMRHLDQVGGVMLGRAAYHNPWILHECEQALTGIAGVPDRASAVHAMTRYARLQTAQGVPVKHISRHLLGLFQGLPGARNWRRFLTEHAHVDKFDERLFSLAMEQMQVQPGPHRAVA